MQVPSKGFVTARIWTAGRNFYSMCQLSLMFKLYIVSYANGPSYTCSLLISCSEFLEIWLFNYKCLLTPEPEYPQQNLLGMTNHLYTICNNSFSAPSIKLLTMLIQLPMCKPSWFPLIKKCFHPII